MSEKDESSAAKHGILFATLLLGVLPVLYFLSTGPVAWSMDKTNHFGGLIPKEVIIDFYSPIIWLHQNTFLRDPLDRYWQLWGV